METGLIKTGLMSCALLCCGLLSGVVHAVDCTGIPEWASATIYTPPPPPKRVQRQAVAYQNNFWTQNEDPASRNGGPGSGQPWTAIGPCDGGGPVAGAPTNFSVILSGSSSASLVWSDNTASENEFQIQRSINGGPFAQVGSNGPSDNTFTDNGLSCGTTYTYRVRARIGTSVTDWSNTGSVTTGSCGGVIIPGAPTNFNATLSGSSANLTWNDNTTVEDEFQIQRSVNGGAFGQVGSNSRADTTFTDSGLSCETTYTYRVRARIGTSVTDWSNTDSVTTGTCGGGGQGCPVWSINRSYQPGDIVLSRASFFRARNPVPPQNGFPSAGFFWEQLPSCPGGYPPSPGGPGLRGVLTEQHFNLMFPGRAPFYTYQGLVNATARPQLAIFGNTGSLSTRKLEVAYALANFEHETGALTEVEEGARNVMCDGPSSVQWPCAPGQLYFGRGPIQLSWNFNYGPAGEFLGLPLLQDPGLVSRDASVAWQTALWYWVTQDGPGDRPAHQCVIDSQGFGCTIRAINGALECSTPQNPAGNSATVASRIEALTDFRIILGIPRTASEGPESCIGTQ